MSEGLKMFYARHERNKNHRIPVSDIHQDNRHGLICEFCDASLSWVRPHTRNGKNISAFLRLQRNAEHSLNCKNTVKKAVTALVAQSRNIEDGEPIIDADASGFVFRMNVLIEATNTTRKAKSAVDEDNTPEEKARKRVRYKKTEKRLADYFNTAAGIAKLRARIEESADKKALSELIKIGYHGKEISWNDFFYDENRYPILFKMAGKINHPIAILITVKQEQRHNQTENYEFYSINGDVCIIENADKTKNYFSPSLTCNDSNVFDTLQPKDEIIVIGNIKTSTNPWKSNIIYKNLNFHIINKNQITLLKDD